MATGFCVFQYFLFFILFFVVIVNAEWAIEDCETPNQEAGTCTSIHSCQPIMKFMQEVPKPISPKLRSFLQSYYCGYEGNVINVCCPFKPIPVPVTKERFVDVEAERQKKVKLLPEDCGVMGTTDKIVFGTKAELLEYPWMALLGYNTRNGIKWRCGGSIINNRYILTAGHCINKKLTKVRIGEYDLATPTDCDFTDGEKYCVPPHQDLAIEKTIRHERYNDNSNYSNDIALLRVPLMDFSIENVQPICLPVEKNLKNRTKASAVVIGWGRTENGSTSSILLKADVPMVSIEECQASYKNKIKVTHRQLCFGGSGSKSDSCTGDSGGPLQIVERLHDDTRFMQLGIVSVGPILCGNYSTLPGIYTKVGYYMDWILDNIKP